MIHILLYKISFKKGKNLNIHICPKLYFTYQYCQGSVAVNMDSEVLLKLLPKEYKYKITEAVKNY